MNNSKPENPRTNKDNSRRSFLKKATAATATLAGTNLFAFTDTPDSSGKVLSTQIPWFRRVTRWGQTNITEKDPLTYDISWWRKQWKKTQIQGIIVNAGGIVAYYPTKVPLHYQAKYLKGRDLFGELCRAAHEDGIAVFARMDSNRANEDLYKAHPDWFTIDENGNPYKAGDLFITCVNGPYYNDHIPAILTEIAQLYHPEGFTDNSWAGLGRSSICFCENCKKSFREKTGNPLPRKKDWDDPVYRQWIRWNYDRRLEIWDLNNRTTKSAGGPDCIWSGMNSGSISSQCESFRDYKEICRRADIIMLDHQSRSNSTGFQNISDLGKIVHGMLGWEKLVPDSMAMYQHGTPTFRISAKPVPEVHLWMLEGFAGGIQPWWHHIGAYHEDRRMYHTAEPINRWHKANEEFLVNRSPIANVGVVWSQENYDLFGRDDAEQNVELPRRGIMQALIKARIPYRPVHADHIGRDASELGLLILPEMAVLSDSQLTALRDFVRRGGNLFATGHTSLYDTNGTMLKDYALGDLFGAHYNPETGLKNKVVSRTIHTYLRLYPEMRSVVDGPEAGNEPQVTGKRHEVLKGFDETDILPFGGALSSLRTDADAQVLMTFIPEFPIYPPETAWMREPVTDIPGLIINTLSSGSRIAFMPADLDRQYALYNLPDHGNLLRNIILWCLKGNVPLTVQGPGLIDCNLYRQKGRMILHLTNLTSAGTWRAPVDEYIPVGPITVSVKLTGEVKGEYPSLLVTGQKIVASVKDGWSTFSINSILNHEVVVLT